MPLVFWIFAGLAVTAVGVGGAVALYKSAEEASQGIHEASDAIGKAAGFALILGAGGAVFYYVKHR